jgi:hypothetical protein
MTTGASTSSLRPPATLAASGVLRAAQLWLIVVNIFSIVLGLLLVFALSSGFFSGYRRSLAEVFWATSAVPPEASAYFTWSMALVGAATVGWGVTNLLIVLYAFGRGERWSFVALGLGTLCWATLELIVSAAVGARAEMYFVISAAMSIIVPVLLAWRSTRT